MDSTSRSQKQKESANVAKWHSGSFVTYFSGVLSPALTQQKKKASFWYDYSLHS